MKLSVLSSFIGEPVALFLMCSYAKFALYALLAAYVTSKDFIYVYSNLMYIYIYIYIYNIYIYKYIYVYIYIYIYLALLCYLPNESNLCYCVIG